MITVRELTPERVGDLVELARAMHGESPVYRDYRFERDKLEGWAKLCLESEDWLCLIALDDGEPIGFIAVGSVDMLFSTERTVDDLGLFVLPRWRGTTAAVRLLRSMEGWASGRGRVIRLGVTTGTNDAQATKFFQRFGYRQTGVMLSKAT